MCFGRIQMYHNVVVTGHILFGYSSISNITSIFSTNGNSTIFCLLRLESNGDPTHVPYTLCLIGLLPASSESDMH